MKGLTKLASRSGMLLVVSVVFLAMAWAQEPVSPIKTSLVATKTSYGPTEPIKMQVSVFNTSGQDVITREGFQEQSFHLKITFTDPEGNLIRHRFQPGEAEPPPPFRFQNRDAVLVEIVPSEWDSTSVIEDARAYFDLTKPGIHTGQALFSLETFSFYQMDPISEALLAFLDDPGRQGFDPVASNKITFEILPPESMPMASVHVTVTEQKGGGGSKKKSSATEEEPLGQIRVRLYILSHVKLAGFKKINDKTYWAIWDSKVSPLRSSQTDGDGTVKLENIPQEDYLIIACYGEAPNFRYMGSHLGADEKNWGTDEPIRKNFKIKQEADGSKSYSAK